MIFKMLGYWVALWKFYCVLKVIYYYLKQKNDYSYLYLSAAMFLWCVLALSTVHIRVWIKITIDQLPDALDFKK